MAKTKNGTVVKPTISAEAASPRPRGRPAKAGSEDLEQISARVPKGIKAEIKIALAQLQILDGNDAPEGPQQFVLAALRMLIDSTAKRFAQRR
jgi:hypothetical protein